ncbi:hypothetical protein CLU79DRAFT_760951 [Phycomyces nitens]|nr:hypothetical protein CLU79DRAFT_760951 [Phycomyces nitens]
MSVTLGPIDPTAWPSSYGRSKRIDLEQFYIDVIRQNTPSPAPAPTPTPTNTNTPTRKGSIRNRPSCGRKVSFSVEPPVVHEYESEQMDAWAKLDTIMTEGCGYPCEYPTTYEHFKRSVMSHSETQILPYESFKRAAINNEPSQPSYLSQPSQPPSNHSQPMVISRSISSPHKNTKRQVPKPRKLDLRPIPNQQYVAQSDTIVPLSPASTISSTASISPITPTTTIAAPFKEDIPLAGPPRKSTSFSGLIFQTLSRMGSLQKKRSH